MNCSACGVVLVDGAGFAMSLRGGEVSGSLCADCAWDLEPEWMEMLAGVEHECPDCRANGGGWAELSIPAPSTVIASLGTFRAARRARGRRRPH